MASPVMRPESGNAARDAVADVVNQTAAPFQNLTNPNASVIAKASGVVGAAAGLANAPIAFLDNAFARATDSIAKVLPSFPAATLGMPILGIPHTHAHPPAMPIPLPGIGVIMTACPSVWIGGLPAARSGDFGLAPTCGSTTPIFEIMTGSSKVFIGGSRAARMLDLTRQCMPAPPKVGAAKAIFKLGKAAQVVQKAQAKVGKAAKVLGVAAAADRLATAGVEAYLAEEATEGDSSAEAAAKAKDAAAEAVGAALAAAMMGADMAMEATKAAMGALMGKDPGAPPCIGAVMMGVPNVLIGGFPMPSWSDIAKGLKKLVNALGKRKNGAPQRKLFCFTCT